MFLIYVSNSSVFNRFVMCFFRMFNHVKSCFQFVSHFGPENISFTQLWVFYSICLVWKLVLDAGFVLCLSLKGKLKTLTCSFPCIVETSECQKLQFYKRPLGGDPNFTADINIYKLYYIVNILLAFICNISICKLVFHKQIMV